MWKEPQKMERKVQTGKKAPQDERQPKWEEVYTEDFWDLEEGTLIICEEAREGEKV